MHKELESWVTLPCHIHLGGALKMIRMKYMHSSPRKSEWSHKIDKIYQACISVAYDQTHDHQCLTSISKYLNQKQTKYQTPPNKTREKSNTLSLEAYDLYIFSPFGNKLPK